MQVLNTITEAQFIASFLKGEITSVRFGDRIKKQLKKDNKSENIITLPDTSNETDNMYRKELLGTTRGYGINRALFENFPTNIEWKRVSLDKNDLMKVKYIDYDYWVELTNGSRCPKDASVTIKNNVEIFGESNQRFLDAVEYLKKGGHFPEMIFVCRNLADDLVVLEGHLRITAYFLAPELIPNRLECLIGVSKDFDKWDLF